jgi:pimeloyl-ACP methyl ester carboxylesterase
MHQTQVVRPALRAAIGVAEDSQCLLVDGVTLAVAVEGEGPDLICLHATGHGGGDFESFAMAMRGQYRVIRVDWPGQGRSGEDLGHAHTPQRYAQLLEGVADQLQVKNPVVIGCSIGGAAALHYAARRPVRALVLCNTAGLVPVHWLTRSFCAVFTRFFRAGSRGARWFPTAFAVYYRRLVLPSPAADWQRERIIAAGYELAPVLTSSWSHFGRPEADIRTLAQALDVPVWFAWARRDRVIPLWMCRPTIRRMRHASLSLFDAGHAAFLEQPAAFIPAFQEFMARV